MTREHWNQTVIGTVPIIFTVIAAAVGATIWVQTGISNLRDESAQARLAMQQTFWSQDAGQNQRLTALETKDGAADKFRSDVLFELRRMNERQEAITNKLEQLNVTLQNKVDRK